MIRIASVLSAALVSLAALSASADWAKVADSDLVKTADQWTIRHDFTTATDSTPYNVSACNGLVEAKFDPSVYDSSTDAGVEVRACRGSSDTTGRCRMVSSSAQTSMSDWTAINSLVEGEGYLLAHPIAATSGGDTARIEIRCTESEALQAGAADGGSHDACRSGTVQGGGLGADGRWSWTCGNYNWHGYQDPTQVNASYSVTCTGDGTPHTSCFRAGETRYIGYGLHRIALAVQYTRDGGRVYLPDGVYTDNGAGDDESGNPTDFPKPYDPEWEARSDFASVGYPTALRVILINRGVRIVGEGIPKAVTVDSSDSTVTDSRPKLFGTWIMDDRGIANQSSASAGSTNGGLSETTEPPAYYRMLVGGSPYTDFCLSTSTSNPACVTNSTIDAYELAQDAPNGANIWGVDASLLADFDANAGTICLADTTSSLGSSESDAIGTCSLNRKIRCWDDDDSDEPRSTGGCNFGAGGSFGACEAPFEAFQTDYVTNSQDLQIALTLTECTDDASSSSDCASPLGVDTYIADVRTPPGTALTTGSCASGNGSTITLGNAWHTGVDLWANAIPFRNFYIGGSGAFNRVFPIERGSMDGKGAGFEGIGRMPANWLTRNSATAAADCLSGGTIGESDDEAACDTDTLSAFAMSYNNLIGPNNLFYKASQYNGKSAIVETYPSGGPNNFIGNTIDTHYRQTVIDWGEGIVGYNTARNLNAWSTKYGWFACFSGRCRSEGNRIMDSPLAYGYLGYTAAQELFVKDEVYSNVLVDGPFFNINSTKNVNIENIDFAHTYYNLLMKLNPGGTNKQKPTVRIADVKADLNFTAVASSTTAATGQPVAVIVVENDATANSRTDDFRSLIVERLRIKSHTDDMCLVWIEDDRYASGAGGGAADTAALTREAASRIIIRDNNLIGSGGGSDNPAIACTGQYRFIASTKDADDSDTWAFELYAPSATNNKVNNAPYPDMLPTISEVGLDADNLPDGTQIRIHDGSSTACAHTNGDLTAGSSIASCVSDPGTSGSATDGTWTAF